MYNYELGTKATVFEGRVNFALSLFNLDWKDTIVFANDSIDDVVGVNPFVYGFASNVGKAKAQGVELEVQFAVTDALRISMGGSYNWKSEIGKVASARFNGVAVEDGNRLPRSPKYNANVAVSYDFRLSGWDATARADAYATGSSFHDISNQRSAPAFHQFNLRLTARQDAWEVSAFIRNVTDEEIVLDFNDVGFRLGYPRSLGLEVAYVPQ